MDIKLGVTFNSSRNCVINSASRVKWNSQNLSLKELLKLTTNWDFSFVKFEKLQTKDDLISTSGYFRSSFETKLTNFLTGCRHQQLPMSPAHVFFLLTLFVCASICDGNGPKLRSSSVNFRHFEWIGAPHNYAYPAIIERKTLRIRQHNAECIPAFCSVSIQMPTIVRPLSQSLANIGNDTWTIQYPAVWNVTVETLVDRELGT